ncbi:hybrid sensor histidine kinase/response regulator [Pseudomonas sp. NFIX28]|uniref:hybrid sensor histidine kinase/response regulator n=1 Tax=Pseudomonas sp. NFIX28 TaxID=1566235 RepID=UPI00089914DC|nr:hybrid sensor histidine kinase/response regulator [Pseudomonas sp. NFIX28]SDZ28575.1 two-component system, NarL family, capsular synthesis sensor histidine kinase RcsC [Pseudomonas sp. NFIX28]
MNHPNDFQKLAANSLRLNKTLMVLGALVLLLLGISYLGVQRMVEEQRDTTYFHFARLMENIHEHESFLSNISRKIARGDLNPSTTLRPPLQKPLLEEGPNIYEGRDFSFSLPYSLKINPDKIESAEYSKIFALGTQLADYYSAFWSASHYQSPQIILLNFPNNFDIAVPAAGRLRGAERRHSGTFLEVVTQVTDLLHDKKPQALDNKVHWIQYRTASKDINTPSLLAYVDIDLSSTPLNVTGANTLVVLTSLLNLSQVNDIERIMQWSIYDQFTLIAPSGEALVGSLKPGQVLRQGLNFTTDGLTFKLISTGPQPWTAIYVIGLRSFLDYAFWPLLGLMTFILAVLGCGGAFHRWYATHVVLPAHQAHASIAESEAFSRAVIDTAPTGLCVVRRNDHKVLLENQRAQQWQDTGQLISVLKQQHDLNEPGQADLEIDGRHLHVAFIRTRYQQQDAWLCAFHDVTRHIDDAVALEEARQIADSANEAKTRFLATMSHEIRTPLYGVLGTLELLGMTALDPRQQAYLQTIQRSSATLFQLISDVLDVSKIEAGQMTLEIQDFCPLELTEDTVRTYSAFAQAKGLQLYACIDAALPDQVRGDPLRIRQILNNLLSNAIKFTDNGRVVLRVRLLQDDDAISHLQWQVSDSGIGISQAQQERLFDPFYQVSDASSQAGAGLGLAICKWLYELMDGQLHVVSEPGLGSSFTLQLPLERAPGTLTDCPKFAAKTAPVYVRAPAAELAQHLCAWLNRLGIETCILDSDMSSAAASAVLVDMLPSTNDRPWPGIRIVATASGSNPSEHSTKDWQVDMHDVRAIARAVSLAQHGAPEHHPVPVPEPLRKLSLRILVAEDNLINSAIIKEQLETLGCSVVLAANGEQALAQWLPGRFDLVLTDVNMPVMNGYELAATLRRQNKDVPIIGVTANAFREEGERCAAVGMNAWMVKPLNLSTLRAQLIKHCKLPAPATEDRPAPAAIVEQIQLSPSMRELFVTTLHQDRQTTLAALERDDAIAVAQQLHSMAGALGAVRASAMATAFVDLECRLADLTITPALALEVRQHLQRLSELLATLESPQHPPATHAG